MKFNEYLRKDIVHNIDFQKKSTLKTAIFMWFCLWLGYFLFAANWLAMANFEGNATSGWYKYFFGSADLTTANNVLKEASDWLVPLGRGLAAIPAALIISKLTHKKTCVLALGFAAISLPLVFAPYFVLFLIGRFMMALGGTLLIINTQPIIAKFFNESLKGKISTLNTLAFNLAAATSSLVFLYNPAKEFLVDHWQIFAGILGALTLLPFIGYWIFGINFEVDSQSTEIAEQDVGYKALLNKSKTWKWIAFFSCLIVVSVAASNKYPALVKDLYPDIFNSTNAIGLNWKSIYVMLFYLGASTGILLGCLNQYKVKKVQALKLFAFITMMLWVFIIAVTNLLYSVPAVATVLIFIAVFFLAFFGIGNLSIALYVPHEDKDYGPKKISIFFSLLWGIAYIVYALFLIILSAMTTSLAIIFLTLMIVGYFVTSLFLKEPVEEYQDFSLKFRSFEKK